MKTRTFVALLALGIMLGFQSNDVIERILHRLNSIESRLSDLELAVSPVDPSVVSALPVTEMVIQSIRTEYPLVHEERANALRFQLDQARLNVAKLEAQLAPGGSEQPGDSARRSGVARRLAKARRAEGEAERILADYLDPDPVIVITGQSRDRRIILETDERFRGDPMALHVGQAVTWKAVERYSANGLLERYRVTSISPAALP